jgi:SAM-dependent methyltransferase
VSWNKNVVKVFESIYFPEKALKRESDSFIIDLINAEPAGSVVLDYGCGIGRYYHFLKETNSQVAYIGYDNSKDMIERAKEKFLDALFTDTLPEQVADIVLAVDVVQYAKSFDELKQNINQIVNSGKKAIFHFWFKDADEAFEVGMDTERLWEFFPSIESITELVNSLTGDVKIQLFEKQLPYKSAVLIIAPVAEVKATKKK